MELIIQCRCGRETQVKATETSRTVSCDCGENLAIPSLSDLGRNIPEASSNSPGRKSFPEKAADLLTPNFHSRIDEIALESFSHAIGRTLDDSCGRNSSVPRVIQCTVCVAPERKIYVDAQVATSTGYDLDLSEFVKSKVELLQAPEVRDRPIAILLRWTHGESAPVEVLFDTPFLDRMPGEFDGNWDEALFFVAGLASNPKDVAASSDEVHEQDPGLISRIFGFFRSQSPATRRSTSPRVEEIDLDQPFLASFEDSEESGLSEDDPRVFGGHGQAAEANMQFEEALGHYDKMLERAAHDPRAWQMRAVCHYRSGSSANAMRDLDEAIRLNPNYATARFTKVQILLELGGTEQAMEELGIAIKSSPRRCDLRLLRASLYQQQGRFHDCISDLNTVLDIAPYQTDAIALKSQVGRPCGELETKQALELLDSLAWLMGEDTPWILVERAGIHRELGRLEDLIEACDEAIALDATYAPAYLTRAEGRMHQHELDLALQDCELALDHAPENAATTHYLEFRIHMARGDHESALDSAQLSLDSDFSLRSLIARADVRLCLEQPRESIQDFRRAIALSPDLAYAHSRLGIAYHLNKQPDEAIRAFDRSIEVAPDEAAHYANRGRFWRSQNEPTRALKDMRKAVQLSKDDPEILMERAQLLASLNSPEDAVEQLDVVISRFPDAVEAISMRAMLNSQLNNFDVAESDYSKLISIYGDNPGGYAQRALMWLRKGEKAKADADHRQAIRKAPEYAEQFEQFRLQAEASLLHEEGNYEEAIRQLSNAIDSYPDFAAAYERRATSHWYAENFVEAIDDYTRASELYEHESLSLLSSRGQVYAELGEYHRAIADLNRVVDSDEKDGEALLEAFALNGRGLAYTGLEKWEEAERDFLRSINLCPENPWVHYNHGLMYFNQGRMNEAAVCFDLALALSSPKLTARKRAKAKGFLEKI